LLKRLGPKKEKVPIPTYATKPVGTWTVDDVKAWCLGSGLKDYEAAFTENAVDGSTLLTLTEKDLKTDLKVTKPLIIRKILNTIKEAKGLLEKTTAAEAKKPGKRRKRRKRRKRNRRLKRVVMKLTVLKLTVLKLVMKLTVLNLVVNRMVMRKRKRNQLKRNQQKTSLQTTIPKKLEKRRHTNPKLVTS